MNLFNYNNAWLFLFNLSSDFNQTDLFFPKHLNKFLTQLGFENNKNDITIVTAFRHVVTVTATKAPQNSVPSLSCPLINNINNKYTNPTKLKSGDTLLSAKVNNINPAHIHDAATISIALYTFCCTNIPPIMTVKHLKTPLNLIISVLIKDTRLMIPSKWLKTFDCKYCFLKKISIRSFLDDSSFLLGNNSVFPESLIYLPQWHRASRSGEIRLIIDISKQKIVSFNHH
ncbi:hypothetical protein AGLY_003059 [Aphis glycines]|uniref:Uncharacterized protein n=1 Tax=Aphis glycines TaxID=307491 RepID=A0A6G0U207_APHGL|nr:hypothetical protein AGLY_003059 [Aphis glycines]